MSMSFPWAGKRNDPEMGPEQVAISSRIRLARNLAGFPFPGNASASQRNAVADAIRKSFKTHGREWREYPAIGFSSAQMEQLEECRIIGASFRQNVQGKSLWLHHDKNVIATVNDEDHLRIKIFAQGLDLFPVLDRIEAMDDEFGRSHAFSFNNELGFLNSRPEDIGCGLKASVLLHLPALHLASKDETFTAAAKAMNLVVSGFFNNETKAPGSLYLITTSGSLGETESGVVQKLVRFSEKLINDELEMRDKLQQEKPLLLMDFCARARGVLENARLISTREALTALSGARLGLERGLAKRPAKAVNWNAILLNIMPGQFQSEDGTVPPAEVRAEKRADYLRSIFSRGGGTCA